MLNKANLSRYFQLKSGELFWKNRAASYYFFNTSWEEALQQESLENALIKARAFNTLHRDKPIPMDSVVTLSGRKINSSKVFQLLTEQA